MRVHSHALVLRERALEIARDELDELAADERVLSAAAPPEAHHRVTSTSGAKA